jgi:broad specificity phosphatase PhoE
LDVRRHSLTKKGASRDHGSLLSADGVRLARQLGDSLHGVGYVLSGPDRRHIETAIAMGYAVDEAVDWPSGYVSGVVEHHDQWQWDQPYARYARFVESSPELRSVVDQHLRHWRRGLSHVDDGESALVISSGGSIEPVLVAAVPGGDHEAWGPALHHLEGATLSFDGKEFTGITMHRRS